MLDLQVSCKISLTNFEEINVQGCFDFIIVWKRSHKWRSESDQTLPEHLRKDYPPKTKKITNLGRCYKILNNKVYPLLKWYLYIYILPHTQTHDLQSFHE